jgi:lipoate-protein ligase A
MTEHWRLILDPPREGAANMAIDEAILETVGSVAAPPTLRAYRWAPPCLSLGYAQPASDADRERIMARGWHLVRRMTGGRAILHTDELTYSVTLPAAHPLAAGSIVESYRRLSAALLDALRAIGLAADADRRTDRASGAAASGPVCFEVPSDYEITAGGKKLIGSAQVRRPAAILQHGSLPLTGDLARIADALAFPDEAARATARDRIHRRATTFAAAAGTAPTWEAAAKALAEAFAARFDLALELASLSVDEQRRADALCAERYAADSWTFRL